MSTLSGHVETYRVSLTVDRPVPQGTSQSLQEYLQCQDTLVDRLQKGPDGIPDRLSKLKEQLDRLSGIVSNGSSSNSQSGRHA